MLESAIPLTTYVCVVTLLGTLQLAGGSQCGVLKILQEDTYRYRLWSEHQTCWVQRRSLFGVCMLIETKNSKINLKIRGFSYYNRIVNEVFMFYFFNHRITHCFVRLKVIIVTLILFYFSISFTICDINGNNVLYKNFNI